MTQKRNIIAVAVPGVYVSKEEYRSKRRVETIAKVAIILLDSPRNSYNPHYYHVQKFTDGSHRFMCDHGGFNFMPEEYHAAAVAALNQGCGA